MKTYTPPSQCDRCIPVQTVTVESFMVWTVEYAHETDCPNRKDHK